MALFELLHPTRAPIPVLVECPHAGLDIPSELASSIGGSEAARRRDADLDVDRLCGGVVDAGATLIRANLSRYVVDLNRAPDDVDPLLHGSGFDRRGAPRGVVWRVATDGRPIAKRPISPAEVARRVELYHQPYHEALRSTLDAMVVEFGEVVLLAVHSMPSFAKVPGSDEIVRRADIVPGTRGRTTADPRFVEAVDAYFRAAGFSVRHDDPYRGGYATARYGRPASRVHAIQLEVSRALYLDEATLTCRDDDAARMSDLVASLVQKLAELVDANARGADY